MIAEATIIRAAQVLAEAAGPARVILFGSYARGDAGEDSDLDFLVIEPAVPRRRAEMVRLRDAVRPLRVPVDILVVSEQQVRDLDGIPGTVLHAALKEGRVLAEPG